VLSRYKKLTTQSLLNTFIFLNVIDSLSYDFSLLKKEIFYA